jgi:hypothetical protein
MPDQTLIGNVISAVIPILVFAYWYGGANARIKTLEDQIEHAVTREEFRALKDQLSQVVVELQGLRGEIINVIRSSRPATGGIQ